MQVDVVVIGGGVVGVTAALTLADRGVSVALCEKGRIAGEQSSRNWGWIRNQRRDPKEIPLMLEAQTLWRQMAARLQTEIGLRQNGIAYLALTEAEMAEHESWLKDISGLQLTSRLLSSSEADTVVGQDGRRFYGGIHTPSDMHAEPALAVPALAHLAVKVGAQIFEQTAVRGLDLVAGKIGGVVTEHGRIACPSIIFAGGVWARPFLENMGLSLPQLAVRSQAMRSAPVATASRCPVGTSGGSIRPRRDGGVTIGRSYSARFDIIPAAFTHFNAFLPHARAHWQRMKFRFGSEFFGALGRNRWNLDQMSPFETARVLDPQPDPSIINSIRNEAAGIYPQLRDVPILECWGGMIDVMPDELPVIGAPVGGGGMILATGLSGHGFGLGPGVGHLAADLAMERVPFVDARPFSPTRFERR